MQPRPVLTSSLGGCVAEERPRELLDLSGSQSLTLSALLALLLGSGCAGVSVQTLAAGLLERYGSLRGLDRAPLAQLRSMRGIGPARASRIKAALELGKRLVREEETAPPAISSAEEAVRYVAAQFGPYLRDAGREHFCLLLLNRRNRPVRMVELTRGSVCASIVDPRDVVREAIISGAGGVILVHNHPSGDADPSPEDIRITARVARVCRAVELRLLDHIVIGRNSRDYYSFLASGLLRAAGRAPRKGGRRQPRPQP